MEAHNRPTDALLARYLSGEVTQAEEHRILEWLTADPAHEEEFQAWVRTWNQAPGLTQQLEAAKPQAWEDLMHQLDAVPAKRPAPRRLWLVAASLLLCVLVGGWLVSRLQRLPQEVYNTDAEIMAVRLPDSTLVWLNQGAKLVYTRARFQQNPEVWVQGEVFVEKPYTRLAPIRVHYGQTTATAGPGSFHVHYRPGKAEALLTVYDGAVQLTDAHEPAITLTAYTEEKVTSRADYGLVSVEANDDPNYLAWKTRLFVLDQLSLGQLAQMLERNHGLQLQFSDSTDRYLKVSGIYENVSGRELLEQVTSQLGEALTVTPNDVLLLK